MAQCPAARHCALDIPRDRLVYGASIQRIRSTGSIYRVDNVSCITPAGTGVAFGRTFRGDIQGISKIDGSLVAVNIHCAYDRRQRSTPPFTLVHLWIKASLATSAECFSHGYPV